MELNKIYTEDCLETMKRMPDDFVDITFTSPPYNRKRNDKYEHYDDTKDDYFEFLREVTDELIRVTKGHVFFNIQKNYYNAEDVYRYIGHYSGQITEVFVWTKANPLPASGFSITNGWEYFFVLNGQGEALQSNTTYTKNYIHTAVNPDTDKSHKAMMHKDVADFFMEKFTKEGDVVYDPFMGGGTTAVCALERGCSYIGSEISADYVALADNRIQKASVKTNINNIVEW